MAKRKVEVLLWEDLMTEKILKVGDTLERRKAVLEEVYSRGNVLDKGEIKGSMYFIIEG